MTSTPAGVIERVLTSNAIAPICFPESPMDIAKSMLNVTSMNPDALVLPMWTEQSVHNEYKENKIVLVREKTRDFISNKYPLSLCQSD